ncbi:hypothetical protein [Fulvivirga sedimenti]|uniref:Uncharacterized protein n=1 Tax=Fulvivirga sedimenti TaxID=2879465 RepID=A0A9X1HUF7_9BACT|nr:hypothetical protein [Fulvivirga sedimenti]MCA6078141.1 hypothetical protein [Fulvivirga sedimenti]
MKKLMLLPIITLLSFTLYAQKSDSVDGPKIVPILSEQPVIYDRAQIQDQLDAMEQPVLAVGAVEVQQDYISTRFDRHEARKLIIPEVGLDQVRKYWSRSLKKSGDGKLRTDGNRLTIDQVVIESVAADPFDVEVQIEETPDLVNLWMALERDSVALSSNDEPQLFTALESYLRNEGLEIYRSKVQDEIDREEKVLRDLNNDLESLIKDNEKMHKKITDNNLKIEDNNRKLETNKIERRNSVERISERKDILLNARTSEEEKDAKKALKTAEKEGKQLDKDRNKMYDQLVDYQKEIQENEQLISQNLNDQRDMLLSIKKQELLVEAYKTKLASIK